MKKALYIFLFIFAILFVIQIIDRKVNGKDYQKIHNFSKNITSKILSDNDCIQDYDEVLKIMFDDDYNNPNIPTDKIHFDKRIKSCKDIMNEIEQVEVPVVRSKNKVLLMEKFKKDTLISLDNYTKCFIAYNNCPKKNSSCFINYIKPDIISDMIISGISMKLEYSIKDILAVRPILWWFKVKSNKLFS